LHECQSFSYNIVRRYLNKTANEWTPIMLFPWLNIVHTWILALSLLPKLFVSGTDVSERIVVLTVEVREEDLVRAAAAAPL